MKLNLFLGFIALTSVLCTACGNTKHEIENETTAVIDSTKYSTVTEGDRKFVEAAASGGMMEVELGEYASKNAINQDVKDFGAKMVADHSKANEQLKTIAGNKGIAVPTAMSEHHAKMVEDLKKKTGKDFDKAYINMMVEDHNEDVSKFENQANSGNDADIKSFAANTVPVLKEHQTLVKSIKDKMK